MRSNSWNKEESGDKRLSTRLAESASLVADVEGRTLTAYTNHDQEAVEKQCRALDEPTPAEVLVPHRTQLMERLRSRTSVLFMPIETKLNIAPRPEDLDSEDADMGRPKWMPLHVTLATTADGLPLGLLRCSHGDPESGPPKPGPQRWLDAYLAACETATALPQSCRVICVMDQDGDYVGLYDAQRHRDRLHMVVRTRHDRKLAHGQMLYASLRSGSAACTVPIEIRKTKSSQKSSEGVDQSDRHHRIAQAEVRYHQIPVPVPRKKVDPVMMYGLSVRENAPPPGEKALEWFLLTTLPVRSDADAVQVLDLYTKRLCVRDYFRVMKTGWSKKHQPFYSSWDRLDETALFCVEAMHNLLLVLLARAVPSMDSAVYFDGAELRFLSAYAKKYKLAPPDSMRPATRLVAILGGYRYRHSKRPPSHQVLWQGLAYLRQCALGIRIWEAEKRAERISQ